MCGFTQGTLYTTTTVYGVLVHQEGAICTTKAQYAPWCTRETIFFEKFDIRGSALPSAARAKKSHYRSGVFVCVSNCCADAVDRLFMYNTIGLLIIPYSVNASYVLQHKTVMKINLELPLYSKEKGNDTSLLCYNS